MALTDLNSIGFASDPAPVAKTFRDKQAGIPHEALARLWVLHGEAGREFNQLQFLARSPSFCVALMLAGAIALAWTSQGASGDTLSAGFAWAASLLTGIVAITRNYIRGFARSPNRIPPRRAAAELRIILAYLGVAWGLGALLVMAALPLSWLAFGFAAGPCLACMLILREDKGVIAFSMPVCFLTATMALLKAWPHGGWNAGLTLAAGTAIAGYSMLQCAIQRRHFLFPDPALY